MYVRLLTLMALMLWVLPVMARSNDAKRSVGFGIGGPGVLGVDGRLPLGDVFEGELGLFYRPGITDYGNLIHGAALAVALTGLWGDARFENGFSVLAGTSVLSKATDRQLEVGWSGRLNLGKHQAHAIDFAVGPALIFVVDYPAYMTPMGDVVPTFMYRATYRRFFD